MIDIIYENYKITKGEEKNNKQNFFKKTFNYIMSGLSKDGKNAVEYPNCSSADSSIISFLTTVFFKNFENIKIKFIINDFINPNKKIEKIDFSDTKNEYLYINHTLKSNAIPDDYLKNEIKINKQLSIQNIFYDYSRFLNDDLICDFKRSIALFYTFNIIFENKNKNEYNLDNLFYFIFGFFDYKYVQMIKNKLDYIKTNKKVFENNYLKEIDLTKAESFFSGVKSYFQNELKFENKYKIDENEIIYNLMNFEEFFNNNRWGVSIGFYESLKFMSFIKRDWNDTSIDNTELDKKIYEWYKDIMEISEFIKTKFKQQQLMQFSNYIF